MSPSLISRSLTVAAVNSTLPPSSSSAASISTTTTTTEDSIRHVDSDFVLILAALLCALICILGLVAVARCAWIRRLAYLSALPTTRPPPPPSSASLNKGLKKKALNSLPKLTYSPPSHDGSCGKFSVDCAICLAEFVSGDEIRLLPPCGHVFHVVCVDTWLKSHSSCPSCRVQVLVAVAAGNNNSKSAGCQSCGEAELQPAASSSSAATTPRQEEINIFLP